MLTQKTGREEREREKERERERERERACVCAHGGERETPALWLLFLYVFSSPWACPM